LSRQFAASTNHRFEFHKRGQLFIRTRNETLPVAAMRVSNEDTFARYVRLLIVLGHLRRRFARFKLGAHFLDLRCLLFELGAQESNFLPLLCANRCIAT
jgi:hypothetical protein